MTRPESVHVLRNTENFSYNISNFVFSLAQNLEWHKNCTCMAKKTRTAASLPDLIYNSVGLKIILYAHCSKQLSQQ
jgi:hypothetical protein